MLNQMTIKMKLLVLTLLTAFGFLINIGLNELNNNYIQDLNNAQMTIERMQMKVYELRKYEKDFLHRKYLDDQKRFQTTFKNLIDDIQVIEIFIHNESLDVQHFVKLKKSLASYEKSFHQVVQLQQKIGLNSDDGLYKKLKNAVQELERNADEINDFYLLSDILTVRKQEKDFMLEKNIDFAEEFKFLIDNLMYDVETQETKNLLEAYKLNFLALVEQEVAIGLTYKSGLKGNMQNNIIQTEKQIVSIKKELESFIAQKESNLIIRNLIIALSIMCLIIAITYMISTNIFNAIKTFQTGLLSFFDYLNRKQNSVEQLQVNGKDEIAIMASTINDNIQNIQADIEQDKKVIHECITVLAQYEQGDFSGKIALQSTNPTFNELTSVINKMSQNLEHNINTILDTFNEYKNSNYTKQVSTEGIKAHLKELGLGVNELGISISKLLKQSLHVGMTLDKSSDILIDNVNILNHSAKNAATSLEETSAALEEITGTIISNSNNVEQMNQYAISLNTSAKSGQNFAQDTNVAMDEITEQVLLINEAISIIDQIAFQTNILSLNAAVEAATAGEAGKGFAVVAQEVRNLASRSAEAAKEIKDLVESATNKTASGKDISSKMIEGYDSLLINIENATKKIDEISCASQEQEKGIKQINESINQLDKQSQQNASIASKTYDIAIDTDKIAKEIVQEANNKEFIGKNEII